MKESKYQAQVIKNLKAVGAQVLNLHGHAMQAPGWPDLFVAHPYYSGWIELKTKNGNLREVQRLVIAGLRYRKSPVIILRWKDGREIVDDILDVTDTKWSKRLVLFSKHFRQSLHVQGVTKPKQKGE